MPRRVMQYLGIPTHQLRATQQPFIASTPWYTSGEKNQAQMSDWGSEIRGDMLHHQHWYLVQLTAGTTLDSPQLHHPIHS